MSLNKMRSFGERNSRTEIIKTNCQRQVKESSKRPQQIIKKNEFVPNPVTYDPKKNLLLKRNMLVIQRRIWETSNTVKQYKNDTLQQFLAQHESKQKPINNLTKLLQQNQHTAGKDTQASQINELTSLRSLDNYSEKSLSHRSNICEEPELHTPPFYQTPLEIFKHQRQQSTQSDQINFMMVGTKKKQQFKGAKHPETDTNNKNQPIRSHVFSTSTIRHDDPLLQTCELLQQPQPAANNFVVSVASSSQVISIKKPINFRAKSATVRRDHKPNPSYFTPQPPRSPIAKDEKLKAKKSFKLNEDIQLLTCNKFDETTTTQEIITQHEPPPEPSVISRNNQGDRKKIDRTNSLITLDQKSSISTRGPIVLKESASYVRTLNLKRAELISASHNGVGQFKMDGQEGQFLIQTSNGCHIKGDSAITTALSLAPLAHKPLKKLRPSSAVHRRARGSTVGLQRRKSNLSSVTKDPFEDIPLFGLVPTYRIESRNAFPKNMERVVYKLVVDKKSLQSYQAHKQVKKNEHASQQTVHMLESPH